MSKSVLVMDTPDNGCMDCKVCVNTLTKTFCRITGKRVSGNHERGGFPEWCPLKPMPEKVEYKTLMSLSEMGEVRGWNDCIDAITGRCRQ